MHLKNKDKYDKEKRKLLKEAKKAHLAGRARHQTTARARPQPQMRGLSPVEMYVFRFLMDHDFYPCIGSNGVDVVAHGAGIKIAARIITSTDGKKEPAEADVAALRQYCLDNDAAPYVVHVQTISFMPIKLISITPLDYVPPEPTPFN